MEPGVLCEQEIDYKSHESGHEGYNEISVNIRLCEMIIRCVL